MFTSPVFNMKNYKSYLQCPSKRDQTRNLVPLLRNFSTKSSLELKAFFVAAYFESWVKLPGPPLSIQKTLREL